MWPNTWIEILAIVGGFLVRLGLPIALTILAACLLQKLDARWREESAREAAEFALRLTAVPCYEVNHCPAETRQACPAPAQPTLPCWEVLRIDGQLQDKCLHCQFRKQVLQPALA